MKRVKFHADLQLNPGALERAQKALKGAPKHVKQHRLSVGIHEQEASKDAIKPASQAPKTDKPKLNYSGSEGTAKLIDVALTHELGLGGMPERSWLRSWFDRNLDRLKQESLAAMRAEYEGDPAAVTKLASQWRDELHAWIIVGAADLAPLSPRTKRERSAAGLPEDPPLYATHQLVEAIRALADGKYAL